MGGNADASRPPAEVTPDDEQALVQLLRWLRRRGYSLPHVLALMVIAGFVGHFI